MVPQSTLQWPLIQRWVAVLPQGGNNRLGRSGISTRVFRGAALQQPPTPGVTKQVFERRSEPQAASRNSPWHLSSSDEARQVPKVTLANSDCQAQPRSLAPPCVPAEGCGVTLIHSSHAFLRPLLPRPARSSHPLPFESADRRQIMTPAAASHFPPSASRSHQRAA